MSVMARHFGSRARHSKTWSSCFGSLFPSQAAALAMQALKDLKDHYALPEPLWTAFTSGAGDPGEDMKLLAVLPRPVIAAARERALLPDGSPLSAVQASHVGMVYNLAKRIIHVKGGRRLGRMERSIPFHGSTRWTGQAAANSSLTERKLKMTQVIDQADDGEFVVQTEDVRAGWYQRYTCQSLEAGHRRKRTPRWNR